MQRAIEKAIIGGLKFNQYQLEYNANLATNTQLDDVELHFKWKTEFTKSITLRTGGCWITLRGLVFTPSLGFVEALVGEGRGMCTCEPENVSQCIKEISHIPDYGCDVIATVGSIEECPMYEKHTADHHRSIMANLPDIEALKQYLIKLAGDTP